jgi:protocatechuate 3,4-dioxygenase beta subunit
VSKSDLSAAQGRCRALSGAPVAGSQQVHSERTAALTRLAVTDKPTMERDVTMGQHPAVQDHQLEDHDRGLSHDLSRMLNRRRALSIFGGTGLAAALAACGAGSNNDASTGGAGSATSTTASTSTSGSGATIPEETGGPYPGDGSNGVNVLTESGIVRSDITTSFGTASGVAAGVPLTIRLKVLDTKNDSVGLSGAAVYLRQCTIDGKYSLYSDGVTQENYLRGVQETDSNGVVSFTSIYPAAYSGRWPHIHFEVYSSLESATKATDKLRTSQLALPEDACKLVYATDGYGASVSNLAQTSLARDMVFSDGYSLQLATVTGDVTNGMTATLNVPV